MTSFFTCSPKVFINARAQLYLAALIIGMVLVCLPTVSAYAWRDQLAAELTELQERKKILDAQSTIVNSQLSELTTEANNIQAALNNPSLLAANPGMETALNDQLTTITPRISQLTAQQSTLNGLHSQVNSIDLGTLGDVDDIMNQDPVTLANSVSHGYSRGRWGWHHSNLGDLGNTGSINDALSLANFTNMSGVMGFSALDSMQVGLPFNSDLLEDLSSKMDFDSIMDLGTLYDNGFVDMANLDSITSALGAGMDIGDLSGALNMNIASLGNFDELVNLGDFDINGLMDLEGLTSLGALDLGVMNSLDFSAISDFQNIDFGSLASFGGIDTSALAGIDLGSALSAFPSLGDLDIVNSLGGSLGSLTNLDFGTVLDMEQLMDFGGLNLDTLTDLASFDPGALTGMLSGGLDFSALNMNGLLDMNLANLPNFDMLAGGLDMQSLMGLETLSGFGAIDMSMLSGLGAGDLSSLAGMDLSNLSSAIPGLVDTAALSGVLDSAMGGLAGSLGDLGGLGDLAGFSAAGALGSLDLASIGGFMGAAGIGGFSLGGSSTAISNSGHRTGLETALDNNLIQPMRDMTAQFTALMIYQLKQVGAYFDGRMQLEAQRSLQKQHALAQQSYTPSQALCRIGSQARTVKQAMEQSRAVAHAINRQLLTRETSSQIEDSVAADNDFTTRLQQFRTTYCHPADLTGNMRVLCEGPPPAERRNLDINYTRLVNNRLTLPLDFEPGNASPGATEQDVMALAKNLYAHDLMPTLTDEDLLKRHVQDDVMAIRSIHAMRGIARNSFAEIVGMRAHNPQHSDQFIHTILSAANVDAGRALEILGEQPSYFAIMEVLTQLAYLDPQFYVDLYETPENVTRMRTALRAIKMAQNRDRYESAIRKEVMISRILEARLRDKQEDITNNIRSDISRIAPPRP